MSGDGRPFTGKLGGARLTIDLRNSTGPYDLDDRTGVQFWGCDVAMTYGEPVIDVFPRASVAWGSFTHVAMDRVQDFTYELDNISYDLGYIAGAMLAAEKKLWQHGISEGADARILIANDVVVDRFWRGNRIGPALVLHTAHALRADAVFLLPAALRTHVRRDGICDSDYEASRPGPAAQRKVEAAWRRAGFRRLADGVVWLDLTDPPMAGEWNIGSKSAKILTDAEKSANERRAKDWWRRRVTRYPPRPTCL